MFRDFLVSLQAAAVAGLIEIVMCLFWANNGEFWAKNPTDSLWVNVLTAGGMVHFRAVHFWFIHRIMHPWVCVENLFNLQFRLKINKITLLFQRFVFCKLRPIMRGQNGSLMLGRFYIVTRTTCTIRATTQPRLVGRPCIPSRHLCITQEK